MLAVAHPKSQFLPLRLALVGPISRPKYLTPEIEAMRAVFANASPSGSLIKPAPDGAIQAQAPHAALLPSRRLKSTRPIAVGRTTHRPIV